MRDYTITMPSMLWQRVRRAAVQQARTEDGYPSGQAAGALVTAINMASDHDNPDRDNFVRCPHVRVHSYDTVTVENAPNPGGPPP